MQMMHQLALRMTAFHALGYVHRDLKPGNVMWLPRENRWTVIDFGCAARTGEPTRLGFSLAYAAPEVVSAFRSGAHSVLAQVPETRIPEPPEEKQRKPTPTLCPPLRLFSTSFSAIFSTLHSIASRLVYFSLTLNRIIVLNT